MCLHGGSMKIVIASGKGGTGKTTVAVNLAALMQRKKLATTLLDCDVEAPNGHLYADFKLVGTSPVTVQQPQFISSHCVGEGACVPHCQFNALAAVNGQILIFDDLCHACGVCTDFCEADALRMTDTVCGSVRTWQSAQESLTLVDGLLTVGSRRTESVIAEVLEQAPKSTYQLIDAPPGTGCAMMAAAEVGDLLLLVTEPTPAGLNDLKLAVSVAVELRKPVAVVINRSGANDGLIETFCDQMYLPIFGRIPFSTTAAKLGAKGQLFVDEPELAPYYEILWINLTSRRGMIPSRQKLSCDSKSRLISLDKAVTDRRFEVTVLSGKGGTGKTTITRLLAEKLAVPVVCDCDVEGADLHCFMPGTSRLVEHFEGGAHAIIDDSQCIQCGVCNRCQFGALRWDDSHRQPTIQSMTCEGCGRCLEACPTGAIKLEPVVTANIWSRSHKAQTLVHSRLNPGAGHSGKLATRVKAIGRTFSGDWQLNDGPPGTGCPVMATLSGTNFLVAVVEPSVSSLHDLQRLVQAAARFKLRPWVVINKFTLNLEMTAAVEAYCQQANLSVIGKLPFDPAFWHEPTQAMCGAFEHLDQLVKQIKRSQSMQTEKKVVYALPVEGESLTAHFGHAPEFHFYETVNGTVTDCKVKTPPPHEPGVLPKWLAAEGANLVLAGGIGQKAVKILNAAGVEVVLGVPQEEPKSLVLAHLTGTLALGTNACSH